MVNEIITTYKLIPQEGYMLFNESKDTYSNCVYCGNMEQAAEWVEAPIAQYEAWEARKQEEVEQRLNEGQ